MPNELGSSLGDIVASQDLDDATDWPPFIMCGGIKAAYRAQCSPLVFEDEPPSATHDHATLRVARGAFDQRVSQDFTVRKLDWD